MRGSNPGSGERLFCFSKGPDRLWGPHSLLFSGHWGCFLDFSGQGVKLRTHFCVQLKWRVTGAVPSLHSFTAWTGTSLPLYVPTMSNRSDTYGWWYNVVLVSAQHAVNPTWLLCVPGSCDLFCNMKSTLNKISERSFDRATINTGRNQSSDSCAERRWLSLVCAQQPCDQFHDKRTPCMMQSVKVPSMNGFRFKLYSLCNFMTPGWC
jgi:hypothetical protein